MDPESQPLLGHGSDVRCRRFRPLTPDEVVSARQDIYWRRTRFLLVLMFWAIMAMFLSIIACLVVMTPQCNTFNSGLYQLPSVPPVHMTFAPLIYKMKEDRVYTL